MKDFQYDAFGNPVKIPANGQPPQTIFLLHSDGPYDPALSTYDLMAWPHDPALARFAEIDIQEGRASAPTSLQRFMHSGQAAVEAPIRSETLTPT
jgi:hypothetical protein